MAFTPKAWVDGSAGGTPITAAELNRVEAGVKDVHHRLFSTYTAAAALAIADENRIVLVSAASAVAITVPPNSAAAIPVGSRIEVVQAGAGAANITAGVGVTLTALDNKTSTFGQWGVLTLIKTATNTWLILGDRATPGTTSPGPGSGFTRPTATRTVNPTADLAGLFNTFVAGDVIHMNAGTYGAIDNRYNITPNGTSASRIQVYAAPGAAVTIKGFYVQYGTYWTIGDVTFDGPTGFVASTNNAGLGAAAGEGESDQVWINTSDMVIDHCTVQDNNWNAGIFITGSNNIVQNCYIYNNGPWHDPQRTHNGGNANNLSHGIYIDSGSGNVVRNNLVERNLAYGVQLYGGGGGPSTTLVYNNTIVDNGYDGATNGMLGGGIIVLCTSGTANRCWNNLITNHSGTGVQTTGTASAAGACTYENNWFFANNSNFSAQTGHTFTGNTTTTNPLYASTTTGTWRLASNSPSINAGLLTSGGWSSPVTDRDNYQRIGNPDMGCYEYHA